MGFSWIPPSQKAISMNSPRRTANYLFLQLKLKKPTKIDDELYFSDDFYFILPYVLAGKETEPMVQSIVRKKQTPLPIFISRRF